MICRFPGFFAFMGCLFGGGGAELSELVCDPHDAGCKGLVLSGFRQPVMELLPEHQAGLDCGQAFPGEAAGEYAAAGGYQLAAASVVVFQPLVQRVDEAEYGELFVLCKDIMDGMGCFLH